ncbi:MAG: hypothetical protein WCB71_11350 [Aestuariivirga sp.]
MNGDIGFKADKDESARVLDEVLHAVEDCLPLGIVLLDDALLVEAFELPPICLGFGSERRFRRGTRVKQLILALGALALLTGLAMAQDAPVFDMGVELSGTTDYMDTGVTNSDHNPSGSITLSPSYGFFYGTIYAATIDYGASEPKIESKFAIGAIPVFGDFSVDFNLARRIKFDDPSADRWLPYVTGT